MVAGVRETAMAVATAAAAEMVNPMAAAGATSVERDMVQVMVAAVAEMVMAVAGARAAEREAMVVTVKATVETEGEREVATEAMEDMVKAMAAAREDGATVKEMVVDITDKGATQDWTTLQCK